MLMSRTKEKKILLFDGVCNLCNATVQFVIKRDRANQFLFGSLQGSAGQEFMKKFGLPTNELNSFILVENGKAYTESTSILRTLKHLGNGWNLLYGFIIVPKFIRDFVYKVIAKNRYKWFGRRDECMVPRPEWTEKFLP